MPPNSNSVVSDQQSVGSNHTCVLRHLTIASSFGWDIKPLVPCVVQRTQCTYQKEKGFAPVFLAVAVVCAVAPCKPLFGRYVSCI